MRKIRNAITAAVLLLGVGWGEGDCSAASLLQHPATACADCGAQ